jgi:SAM-dependent methyltransferase
MAGAADWVPYDVDVRVPSAARVYDFLLGGARNFEVDRLLGKKVLAVQPNGRQIARSNRAFLNRAVRFLVDQGITRFLDLGSGIPTVGNVHEVARRANPDCRVVYVDHEPVAVALTQLILRDDPLAAAVDADLRRPDVVLNDPTVREFVGFDRPVGLLMVASCHFVPDADNPRDIIARYVSALPSGSFVALSHLTADQMPAESAGVAEVMRHSSDPMYFRSYDEVAALFDGLDLVEPGVVDAPKWRPDDDTNPQEGVYVGVARVP